MFCPNCGTNLGDGMKFCPNCGTATSTAIPTGPANSMILTPEPSSLTKSGTPTGPAHSVILTPAAPMKDSGPTYTPYRPTERAEAFNIASIVILAICLLLWFTVPFIQYDLYYTEVSATSMEVLENMLDSEDLEYYAEYLPVFFVPLTSLVFINLGILFTCLRKHAGIRTMAILNSAMSTILFLAQASVDNEYINILDHLDLGFYLIGISMFVLIFFCNLRFEDEVSY